MFVACTIIDRQPYIIIDHYMSVTNFLVNQSIPWSPFLDVGEEAKLLSAICNSLNLGRDLSTTAITGRDWEIGPLIWRVFFE